MFSVGGELVSRFSWGIIRIMWLKQQLKKNPWDALALFGLGGAGLATGIWASVIIFDDALITFRVAENLARGQGFVYNLGERVQVTTTPLYTMLLAAATWLFGSAYRAALPLNLILSVLIPILAYDLGRRLAGRITGLIGALLLTMAPLLVISFSMETYLYVTLILASMVAYVTQRYWLAGVLVGLTGLVRGDAALLAASMLTYDLLAYRGFRWRLIIPALVIPAGWYLFAVIYFGSPFPATLNAKVAQGEFNWLGAHFLDGLALYADRWIRLENLDTFRFIPFLVGLGLLRAIWSERPWLILVARDLLQVAAFAALSIPAAEWYYAALMPGMALLSARGIQIIAEGLMAGVYFLVRRSKRPYAMAEFKGTLTGILAAVLAFALLRDVYLATAEIVAHNPDWKTAVYPDTARWIAENTNTSANFATIDIGHLGYWSGRHVIDIVGLAQTDVAPYIAQGDFGYAIRHYQPDMVLLGFSWLPEIQSTPWFQSDYAPRRYFKFQAYDEPLILFSRRQGVKVQPDIASAAAIQPLNVDFNRQIRLTGYQVGQPLIPGSHFNLTLFWQADAPIEVDFTVFVQLVDGHDRIVAQRDSKPQNGFYGTSYWQPGEQIIDPHAVLIGPGVRPGEYDILVGFYEAETNLRLQILDQSGAFQSDHIRISGIQVGASS